MRPLSIQPDAGAQLRPNAVREDLQPRLQARQGPVHRCGGQLNIQSSRSLVMCKGSFPLLTTRGRGRIP
jgi:hypothetical protein